MASSPDAAHYVDSNIGIALDLSEPDSAETVNANVGFAIVLSAEATGAANSNIGIGDTHNGEGQQYAYEGDVDTSTPNPHIWFVKPRSGSAGDGFNIYGHGFGPTQATYSGLAQYRESVSGPFSNLSATSWERIAASADAYGPNRLIDEDLGLINTEYGVIGVTIPLTAVPPGIQVRVETDGS